MKAMGWTAPRREYESYFDDGVFDAGVD